MAVVVNIICFCANLCVDYSRKHRSVLRDREKGKVGKETET